MICKEAAKIKDHVQTLKGEISDYALVTEDKTAGGDTVQVGDIVYVKGAVLDAVTPGTSDGVEDREGNVHYGTSVVEEVAE